MGNELTCENCVFKVMEFNEFHIDAIQGRILDEDSILCSFDYNIMNKSDSCDFGMTITKDDIENTN